MKYNVFEKLIVRGGLVGDNNQLKLFKKISFSMYPARAFAITLQTLSDDFGAEYVKELGSVMGFASTNHLWTEINKIKTLIDKDFQTINHLIEISGFGKVDGYDQQDNQIRIRISDHPVIGPAKNLFGDKAVACAFYGKVFGEYIKRFHNVKRYKLNHNRCVCKGDNFCEWSYEL